MKLSALHPRYRRSQRDARDARTATRGCKGSRCCARRCDVGLNIDAEESERLDLSLDLLEALCRDPELAGWNGIGFVVQAYQKRAYPVLGWIIDLARAHAAAGMMVRLVKGAYWDSEIKRAQVEGLEGFPVFTRKIHTDVSYIACAQAAAGRARRGLPAIRDAQRADAGDDPRDGGRQLLRRAIRVPVPARHGRAALRADRRRRRGSTGRAASTRRSARTRRCSPISCGACWRTAPTPRSSTASPTRTCPSRR